ncbi:MAG: 23S rRNA (pseudouridine(1915)-N(3))-methyltransferase RlmH [Clostridia bacterium]
MAAHIRIIAVGKLKRDFFASACSEYIKRISRFANIEVVEIKDESDEYSASEKELFKIKAIEGEKILNRLDGRNTVVALAISGKKYDSCAFSALLEASLLKSSTLDFIIGGSNGLSSDVLARADYCVSFSDLTFPHMLFRVMLLEQIYRAFKISTGEKYHK